MWGPLKAYRFMYSDELGEPCAFLEVKLQKGKVCMHLSAALHFTVSANKTLSNLLQLAPFGTCLMATNPVKNRQLYPSFVVSLNWAEIKRSGFQF